MTFYIFIIILTLSTYLILRSFINFDKFSLFSISYPLGIGVFTQLLFLLNLNGIAYSLKNTNLLLFALITIAIVLSRFNKISFLQEMNDFKLNINPAILFKGHKILNVLVLISLLTIIFIFFSANYWPIKDWDSIVLYDFRALTFKTTGFMDDGIARGYFFGYPLNTSLFQMIALQFNYPYPAAAHALFYLSLVMFAYRFIGVKTSGSWAIIWTSLIATMPALYGHAQMSYTNLAYTVYVVFGYALLSESAQGKNWRLLIVASTFFGLSTWTRSAEPFWLVGILLISLIGIVKYKNLFLVVMCYLIFLFFKYPWSMFEAAHGIQTSSITANSSHYWQLLFSHSSWNEIVKFIKYIFNNIILYQLPVLIMMFYSSFMQIKNKAVSLFSFDSILALSIYANLFMTIVGIWIFSHNFKEWTDIGGSAQRMTIFFAPLILLYSSSVTWKFFSKVSKSLE